jgi:hypothetical protein
MFATSATDALVFWPHASPALAGGADCLHGIHEALRAVLAMQNTRLPRFVPAATSLNSLYRVLQVLDDAAWLHRLRTTCGLSQADEAELRQLQQD